MNETDSLRHLYKPNLDEIRGYLSRQLPSGDVHETEDFDRDGVVFKRFPKDGAPFRLFVSHEFLSDFDQSTIRTKLQAWRVSDRLKSLAKGHTLFLTTEGTFIEQTEGPTLRKWAEDLGGSFGFSKERSPLMERVLATPIDGIPLIDIPTEMQGDPEYYINYSEAFASALITSYLLDAAGYHDYQLFREPQTRDVDFRVMLNTGQVAYIELKSAQNPLERRAHAFREQINVGLRKALRERNDIARKVHGYFVQVTLPEGPSSRDEVEGVVSEILRFVQTTQLEGFERGTFVAFDADAFPLLTKLAARVYVAEGATHLSVQEGATTFSPDEPYRRAAQIVQEQSRRQFSVQPVWLAVSLANTPAEFSKPNDYVRQVPAFDVNKTPFEQIIIGYPGNAVVYRREPQQRR